MAQEKGPHAVLPAEIVLAPVEKRGNAELATDDLVPCRLARSDFVAVSRFSSRVSGAQARLHSTGHEIDAQLTAK